MTAENAAAEEGADEVDLASMRPRPMTAENDPDRRPPPEIRQASMRPRPMTAENRSTRRWPRSAPGFNEAAADDRGKPLDVDRRSLLGLELQ